MATRVLQEVRLDRVTERVCMSISARVIAITGIDDRRYCNRIPIQEFSQIQTQDLMHLQLEKCFSSLEAFTLAHGPTWEVPLGRRDSLTANRTVANLNLPSPNFTLDHLISSFANQNLTVTDLVALSDWRR